MTTNNSRFHGENVDNNSKRAKLIEIDKENRYSQLYECEDGFCYWLSGIGRAENVKVGDTGTLEYRTGPGYGMWFFVKDNE
jgi:hypothetical protein